MSNETHLSLITRLNRLVDWFIPADLAARRDMRQGARMFLFSHFFGPFIGNVIPAYLYFLNPASAPTLLVLAGSITLFWTFPLMLRWTGQYVPLALLSVQNLLFAILWGCYYYGGVSSPFLPWLLTVPLLAFFYLGPAWMPRVIVLGMIAANLSAFYAYYLLGHPFPEEVPLSALQMIGIISILCAAVYVSMMALYYSKIFASQAELEVEVRGHLTTAAELRSAMAEAERAGAAKSAFLAKMTHELRTPLNAVIGYSQMLLEDAEAEGDTQTRVDLEKIHTAGQHLLQLVTDVLDLSKIEAGKMELYNERINVTVLIERAVASCKDLATSNGDKLSVQLDDRLGTIVCDVRKLEQVVTHVLRNAAKFTRNGRITVSARRKHMVQGDKIVVSVRDNGPGISRDSIPELFEQFSVATDSTPTKYGGAGLGLALSLKLCRLMGGNIEVASELGVGSCFTITIPASPKNAAPPVEQMIEAVRPAVTKRLAEPVAETESLRQLPTLGVVNG